MKRLGLGLYIFLTDIIYAVLFFHLLGKTKPYVFMNINHFLKDALFYIAIIGIIPFFFSYIFSYVNTLFVKIIIKFYDYSYAEIKCLGIVYFSSILSINFILIENIYPLKDIFSKFHSAEHWVLLIINILLYMLMGFDLNSYTRTKLSEIDN